MKKFSEFNNRNNKIEESVSKKEFINKLVDDMITVNNGIINGKEELKEALNKIILMNDYKTTINVLENIKVITYKNGLNLTWLNETIENEKNKLNNIVLEKYNDDSCDIKSEEDEELEKDEEEKEDEEIKESVFNKTYKEEHMIEMESLNDIYKNIINENR